MVGNDGRHFRAISLFERDYLSLSFDNIRKVKLYSTSMESEGKPLLFWSFWNDNQIMVLGA